MQPMNENPAALLPEVFLAVAAVAGLLLGGWLPRRRQWQVRLLVAVSCVSGIAATAEAMTRPAQTVFAGTYTVDIATNVARLVVLAATLIAIGLSTDSILASARETEFYVLAALASLGAIALAGANDLLVLAAGYLLASIPLYALTGFGKDAAGTEAALKYFLLGALFGVLLLVGVTVLSGVGRGADYPTLAGALPGAPRAAVAVGVVAVLAGLLFKAGAVPTHFWVPDVTQGASTPVAAFVTTIPKVGALLAIYRLFSQAIPVSTVDWRVLVAIVAAATMTLGNLGAFFQDNARRLLAYSTISQVGYLLMAVVVAGRADLALASLAYYLGGYAVTNLGAFAVVAELPDATSLRDYTGLFARQRWLALSLVVCLLGLVGTPPTAVFVGKLTIFTAAFDGGYGWLAVLAAVNTVASVFYYLRWIAPMFQRAEQMPQPATAGAWSKATAYAAAATSVAIGLSAGPLLDLATGPSLLR